MYERSAIVLERYFDDFFGFDKNHNIRNIRKWYERLIEEIERCQNAVKKEENTIAIFDEAAGKIQRIQKAQTQIYNRNMKIEEIRNQIFCEIGENKEKTLEKIEKLEKELFENEEKMRNLKDDYIENLGVFLESQAQRMVETKERRVIENNQLELVRSSEEEIKDIDLGEIKKLKEFPTITTDAMVKDIEQIMFDNGKNEPIGFNSSVIKNSVSQRVEIAKEEAKCYVLVLERLKRVIIELNSNNAVPIIKYQKIVRDVSAKINMLEAKKAYIVGFLDNERVTVISGEEIHGNMMAGATNDFLSDVKQIDNLYELILREIANKSTKKAYDELYNKTYLQDIESNDKNLKQEINNINTHSATLITSNYWRTYGIKNIYNIFVQEVVDKFEKDLSDYEEKPEKDVFEVEDDLYEDLRNTPTNIDVDELGAVEYDYEFEKDEYDEETELEVDLDSVEEVEIQDLEDIADEDFEDDDREEYDLDEDDLDEDDFSDLVELSDLEEDDDDIVIEDVIDEEDITTEDDDDYDDYYDVYEDEEDDEEDDDDDDDDIDDDDGEKRNILSKMFGDSKKGKRSKKNK